MPNPEKLLQSRLTFSEVLLEEARPFMTAEPRVWARQFGEAVTFGETFGQMAKKQLPFGKAVLRDDALVFHDIPTRQGMLYAVQYYGGAAIRPTDFLMVIDGNIPRAAFLKEPGLAELTSKWATALTEQKQKDDWKEFLDNLERGPGLKDSIRFHASWTFHAGSLAIKLPYTMQLLPLGNGQFVYLFKNTFRPGLWSVKQMKFEVEEYLNLAAWLKEAATAYAYAGPPAPLEVPIPTLSLLAIPELAGLIADKGVEIPWPASNKVYVAPPAAPAAAQAPAAATRTTKFCTSCGAKIVIDARFCNSCGAKQPE